jgi:hypothetical protein
MAPPPTIAPPQAQAQSFARAIFTDIASHPVLRIVNQFNGETTSCFHRAAKSVTGKSVNPFFSM